MKVGIIGGGINGLMIAWQLSSEGHNVHLYESGKVLSQTSSSSSKLLHGGIRYLEQGHLGLVKESLADRAWWLKNAPEFCWPIKMCIPVYRNKNRSGIKIFLGALLYRFLAGRHSLGPVRFIGSKKTIASYPDISSQNLSCSISFYDAQMNEEHLGHWVKKKAQQLGTIIYEDAFIECLTEKGKIQSKDLGIKEYDILINATGPWAAHINKKNNIDTKFDLQLIRGSHLVIDHEISSSYIFQEDEGRRIVFVMPYLGKTLIGTTEVPQPQPGVTKCSQEECDYLIGIFNNNFIHQINESNILSKFSGLRPIVIANKKLRNLSFSAASRECKVETIGKLITVYGGKWTSAPSVAKRVCLEVKKLSKTF
jgi:glycerol-3-phosphate dehydrogenase